MSLKQDDIRQCWLNYKHSPYPSDSYEFLHACLNQSVMKVLMFGWEFPPHISGGLGTACLGITKSLTKTNTQILFVIPRADQETREEGLEIISAGNTDVPEKINLLQPEIEVGSRQETLYAKSWLSPYTTQDVLSVDMPMLKWNHPLTHATMKKRGKVRYNFTGGYGPNLMEEVDRYAWVATEIAKQKEFDIIHAHDWLTFSAGIAAKKISGKPLVIHVHATEFDRAGNNGDPRILKIEREGMEAADSIIAVSNWTKRIITEKYHIRARKVRVIHNGIQSKKTRARVQRPQIGKPMVTFLGRITFQKGPQYFVDAAAMTLKKFPDVHFVMVGSGDLLPGMIERVASLGISSHFHFTGFLKSDEVERIWSLTNIYVMPSVSEPFGISPLEAAQAGVPVIISNQSGVSEVIHHVVKVDFWDTEALANAICNLLKHRSFSEMLKTNGKEESGNITWDKAVKKINTLYHELTR